MFPTLVLAAVVTAPPATETNTLGMKLVRLPAGEFRIGLHSDHDLRMKHPFSTLAGDGGDIEKPSHLVRLTRPFAIASTEITVGQFRKFVAATGYRTDAEKSGKGAAVYDSTPKDYTDRFRPKPDATWKSPGFEQTDSHPVTCVSWRDAVAFCEWLSKKENATYRLPTEAEWEYACRAGTETLYSFGDREDDAYTHGNVADETLEKQYPGQVSRQRADYRGKSDGFAFTAPVGTFKPNPWGLFDTHGNVWEWCSDRFHDREYRDRATKAAAEQSAPKRRVRPEDAVIIDPKGPEMTKQHEFGDWRSMRGGSWFVAPAGCRCDYRGFAEARDAFSHVGFRVVKELR